MSYETSVQPKLADLLAGYLNRKAQDQVAGVSAFDPEVVPYEAGPVQPIDAKLAWDETLAVTRFFAPQFDKQAWQAPPSWPNLVAAHEPVVALACAVGNFPQLVRHLHTILQTADLSKLRPVPGRPVAAPALIDWVQQISAQKQSPQLVLALGALRLAKQFEEADKFIEAHEARVPAAWRAAWDNEKAALAWHRGQTEQSREMWQKMAPTVPVLFNRGMADLFLDRLPPARTALTEAVAQLPENGAWHHLGRLYLTLAQRVGK